MELHLSGVEVPPLGSYKDKVYRGYLTKKSLKEVYKNKVVALAGIVAAAQDPPSIAKLILDAFDNYSNMEANLETVKEEQELSMREEYEFWKNSRPKLNIGKDGKLTLPVHTLIPKS